MTIFDEREAAFESKFVHDEDLKFRALVRCNKLLGLWAASLLGKSKNDSENYYMSIISADLSAPGHDEILAKLAQDLRDKVSLEDIQAKYAELLPVAIEQVQNEHQP